MSDPGSGSVAFDRAAEFYDQSRAISDDAMAQTIARLSKELAGRGRCLEVGAGTGLVALPLHAAGIPLAGIDLSAPMLGRLIHKAGGTHPFPLVRGDATRMPFRDHVFGAAHLRWVLHLIPGWRTALAEMARVVRPGGVVLVCLGAYDSIEGEIRQRFADRTGASVDPIGLAWGDTDALDTAMADLGGRMRTLEPIVEEAEERLDEFLDEIEANRYSWTWPIADEIRLGAVRDLRVWAAERFGPLDVPRRGTLTTVWRAYDLP
jgi:ubiquinone/menaquinone biosynthesis C-methylase UbiE